MTLFIYDHSSFSYEDDIPQTLDRALVREKGARSADAYEDVHLTKLVVLRGVDRTTEDGLDLMHRLVEAYTGDGCLIYRGSPDWAPNPGLETNNGIRAYRIDKHTSRLVALTSPDNADTHQGVHATKPTILNAEQFSEWTYLKMERIIPIVDRDQELIRNNPLTSSDVIRLPATPQIIEWIYNIPEAVPLLEKFNTFHSQVTGLVKQGTIASDQTQPIDFRTIEHPDFWQDITRDIGGKVGKFIMRFYHDDLTATLQNALRFFYKNALENTADRERIESLIEKVMIKDSDVPEYSRDEYVAGTTKYHQLEDKTKNVSTRFQKLYSVDEEIKRRSLKDTPTTAKMSWFSRVLGFGRKKNN